MKVFLILTLSILTFPSCNNHSDVKSDVADVKVKKSPSRNGGNSSPFENVPTVQLFFEYDEKHTENNSLFVNTQINKGLNGQPGIIYSYICNNKKIKEEKLADETNVKASSFEIKRGEIKCNDDILLNVSSFFKTKYGLKKGRTHSLWVNIKDENLYISTKDLNKKDNVLDSRSFIIETTED